ncbi:MAG: ABC transporter ATP-binding protein [Candidatus Omnitrophota bacterium]
MNIQDKGTILSVRDLTVTIGTNTVIDNISFSLCRGELTAMVGESGSGKTLTALSLLDLLPFSAIKEKGEVVFNGRNIFDLKKEAVRKIRGNEIAMVFQEPCTALNPVMRTGEQLAETLLAHKRCSKKEIEQKTEKLFHLVRLSPELRKRYPHQLSGGQRQRVILAIALSCDPDVLILDEPTTALDVSIQKEILDLIKKIQKDKELAIFFITHDFSVVNKIADKVCVMKQGEIVERGGKNEVLKSPAHPYTQRLIACIPRLGDERKRLPEFK